MVSRSHFWKQLAALLMTISVKGTIRWWQFAVLTLVLLAGPALAWVLAQGPAAPRRHADWQAPYVAPSHPEVAMFPPVAPDFPSR